MRASQTKYHSPSRPSHNADNKEICYSEMVTTYDHTSLHGVTKLTSLRIISEVTRCCQYYVVDPIHHAFLFQMKNCQNCEDSVNHNVSMSVHSVTSCACGDTICPCPHAVAHLHSIAFTPCACGA